MFKRAARLAADDHVDELVLLTPEFPRRMIGQIAEGLGHADPRRGLAVWDLLADDGAARKRLAALLRWLGEEPGVMRRMGDAGSRRVEGEAGPLVAEWEFASRGDGRAEGG